MTEVQFTGPNAAELESAFNYLYSNSATFSSALDEYTAQNSNVTIVVTSISALDIPGILNVKPDGDVANAPGFNINVGDTLYLGVNFNVTATLIGPGVPDDWFYSFGSERTDQEMLEFLRDVGYIDPITSFPDDPSFWFNNARSIPGYAEWSQLPNVGGNPLYYNFYKWAYYESGVAESGVSFQDFVSTRVDDWSETEGAFAALIRLKNSAIILREMTIEERLGHEFGHEFVVSGGLSNEQEVIEYMNGLFAAMGLPLIREVPSNDFAVLDLISRMAQHGYSMPTILEFVKGLGLECFLSGTPVSLPGGSTKPIESICVGDLVLSYDATGTLVSGRVTRTFRNEVSHLLDVHGLKVTPGHATLCGDGMFKGRHVPIIDILLSDGALVRADGSLVRMAINAPVGSTADVFVKVACAHTPEDMQADTLTEGEMRVGTLLFDRDGVPVSVLDCLTAEGYAFDPETGLIAKPGEAPHPLFWFGRLPRPEDYILTRSQETLEGILTDGEWEGSRSALIEGRLRQTMVGRVN
jgi:hypothetical protein